MIQDFQLRRKRTFSDGGSSSGACKEVDVAIDRSSKSNYSNQQEVGDFFFFFLNCLYIRFCQWFCFYLFL